MRIVPERMPAKYKPNLGPLNFMHAAPTNEWLLASSNYNVTTAREKVIRRTVFNTVAMAAFAGLALKGMDLGMHDNALWYWPTGVATAGALKKFGDIFAAVNISASLGNDRPPRR